MIDIKSNLDRLEDSASTFYLRGGNDGASTALSSGDALQTASDLRGAIMDIQNLRDHITNLEKAPVDLGAVINNAVNGRIEAALTESRRAFEAALTDSVQLDGLEARLETLEQFKDDLNVEADDIDGLESFIDGIVETHLPIALTGTMKPAIRSRT